MKVNRIILVAFMAWVLFLGGVMAGQSSSGSDSPAIIENEHQLLTDQLMKSTQAKIRIKTNAETGKVDFIGTDPSNPIPQPVRLSSNPTPEEAARGFLSVYGTLFGLKDQAHELNIMSIKKADQGWSFVRFQQAHSGVPVFGGESIVQVNSSNNIISAQGKILSDIHVDTSPTISADRAKKAALQIIKETYQKEYTLDISSLQVSKPELWIYNPALLGTEDENKTRLVWRMEVTSKELLPIRELVLVDAHLGDVVLHFNQIDAALNRKIYDHNNTVGVPLRDPSHLRRSEGDALSGITDVDNAYDYAGDTYDFYFNYHGRDSINNAGMMLISTTRYCPNYYYCPYENAFWNGSQMVYGDGFASADDVVAHEMTHGVTQRESKLIYMNQSGAINESFSDIWGEFVDLTNGKGDDSAGVRWLLGEDLSIGAIRDMSDPTNFGDPDRMWSSNYWCHLCDNRGVHYNSGIANKAAYLMTDGGNFNGITVTGLGITKVAKIFYEAQTNLLTSTSNYNSLYNALLQSCTNLVGTDGITDSDCLEVQNAIDATEMDHKTPTNKLKNPSFESGRVVWKSYSSGHYYTIYKSASTAVCGSWFAYLGGVSGLVDYIYQDVTIPSNATQAYLQFFYGIIAYYLGSAYDYMNVEVRNPSDNSLLTTLESFSNLNDTNYYWVRSALYDLLSFKGQKIRLRFYGTTVYPTSFFIDDVVLKVVAGDLPVVTSLKINAGAATTSKAVVKLHNVATNSPTHYMASESPTFDGLLWQVYSKAPRFTLSTGIGTKTVYFKVKNGIGESSVVSYDTIEAVAPIANSLKINAGATTTAKGIVTLNNVAINSPTHYMASEDPGFSGASWQTYSKAPKFALSDGSGTKTVYFKVQNNFAESNVLNDTITAAGSAPVVTSFKINSGALNTAKAAVKLNNAATNWPMDYMASEDPGFSGASWQTYTTAPSFTLSASTGTKTIYFKVKNIFGESSGTNDTINALAPTVTSFKINNGVANTTNAVVKLNNASTNSPIQYIASELSDFSDTTWQTYSTAPSFTLSSGTGTKTIYFKVQNNFAESSFVTDTINRN